MSRLVAACMVLPLYLTLPLTVMAQVRDPRVDKLTERVDELTKQVDESTKETSQLKRTVADQEKRIAELEKAMKALQTVVAPVPEQLPSPTPPWHTSSNWTMIKIGMSEAQVVDLLGPPTRVETAVDVRTLYYQPDPRSTTGLSGSVTLKGDRVTAMVPPAF
jgi:uncharacterized coiled-coil protein SlyX